MPIQNNPDVPLDNKQLRVYDSTGSFIRMSVDELIASGLNSWKGWKCSAGVRGLYIDYDGNIWNANCASSNRNASAHYTAVQQNIHDKWTEYRESIIGADGTPERAAWIKKNVGEDHWPMPKNNWENCEAQIALMAEIARLEKLFFSEEFFKKSTGADINSSRWKWESTLEDIPDNWGLLGNIREGIDIPDTYVTCPFSNCGCGADVILSKAKTNTDIKLLDVTHNGYDGTTRVDNFGDSITDSVGIEMNFPIPYQILWDLGRRCNYSCDYCWPSVHSNTEKFPDFESIIKAVDMLIDNWSDGKEIRWNFGGGEPTIHPQFLEILKYLKSKGQWVLVTTNGSRATSYFEKIVPYLNSINMSAHFESMDSFSNHQDRFLNNCKKIIEYHSETDGDHWLEVKLMTPPGFLDRALKFKESILDMGIYNLGGNGRQIGEISLVPIRSLDNSSELVGYNQNEIKYFQEQ